MRFFLILIILIFLVFKFWPDQPTPTVEESFIGPQLSTMKKAGQIEQQYLEALEKSNERIERQADGG
jgi:hypothetical protein